MLWWLSGHYKLVNLTVYSEWEFSLCLVTVIVSEVSKYQCVQDCVCVSVTGYRRRGWVQSRVFVLPRVVCAWCAWTGGQWVVGAVYLLCLSDGSLAGRRPRCSVRENVSSGFSGDSRISPACLPGSALGQHGPPRHGMRTRIS